MKLSSLQAATGLNDFIRQELSFTQADIHLTSWSSTQRDQTNIIGSVSIDWRTNPGLISEQNRWPYCYRSNSRIFIINSVYNGCPADDELMVAEESKWTTTDRNCLPQEQMGNISEGACYFARITRVGYEKILGCQCKVSFLLCL